MRVNYVMISHRFNFLAEAALKTVPVPVIVLHVCKTEKQLSEFRPTSNVLTLFSPISQNMYHSSVLRWLLARRNRLFDCDAIIFMDHDYLFPHNEFESISSRLLNALNGKVLAAIYERSEARIFSTIPMFAVKPTTNLIDWHPKRINGRYYDVGQAMGFSLHKAGILGLVNHSRNGVHWSSIWNYKNNDALERPDDPEICRDVDRYIKMLKAGYFSPSSTDIEIGRSYAILRRAFAVCA